MTEARAWRLDELLDVDGDDRLAPGRPVPRGQLARALIDGPEPPVLGEEGCGYIGPDEECWRCTAAPAAGDVGLCEDCSAALREERPLPPTDPPRCPAIEEAVVRLHADLAPFGAELARFIADFNRRLSIVVVALVDVGVLPPVLRPLLSCRSCLGRLPRRGRCRRCVARP